MSIQILTDKDNAIAAIYNDASFMAFGPVFRSEGRAKDLARGFVDYMSRTHGNFWEIISPEELLKIAEDYQSQAVRFDCAECHAERHGIPHKHAAALFCDFDCAYEYAKQGTDFEIHPEVIKAAKCGLEGGNV